MMAGYKKQGIQLYGQQNLNFVIMHTHKHIYTPIHINSIDKDWKEIQKILTVLSLDSEIADNFFLFILINIF